MGGHCNTEALSPSLSFFLLIFLWVLLKKKNERSLWRYIKLLVYQRGTGNPEFVNIYTSPVLTTVPKHPS